MKLQDRNLSRGLQGTDVQLLQSELRLLSYVIRTSELQEQLFGDDTEAAVKGFQRKRGLRPTGEADAQTLRLIDAAVKALPPRPHVVRGRVVFQHRSIYSSLQQRKNLSKSGGTPLLLQQRILLTH